MKRKGKGRQLSFAPKQPLNFESLKQFQRDLDSLGSEQVDVQARMREAIKAGKVDLRLKDDVRTAKMDYLRVQINMLYFVLENPLLLSKTRFVSMDQVHKAVIRCEKQFEALIHPKTATLLKLPKKN